MVVYFLLFACSCSRVVCCLWVIVAGGDGAVNGVRTICSTQVWEMTQEGRIDSQQARNLKVLPDFFFLVLLHESFLNDVFLLCCCSV